MIDRLIDIGRVVLDISAGRRAQRGRRLMGKPGNFSTAQTNGPVLHRFGKGNSPGGPTIGEAFFAEFPDPFALRAETEHSFGEWSSLLGNKIEGSADLHSAAGTFTA